MTLSRRRLLGMAACSLAAHPFITPVTLAAAPWEERLVVIVLRGGMDGLDVLRPLGDPAYAALRPTLGAGPAADLDGFFALHPGLAALLPLWSAGELAFASAVSTPYRDKRSHFDGQAILEAGSDSIPPGASVESGWLNRLVGGLPGASARTAYAIGQDELAILAGAAPHGRWAPEAELSLTPQQRLLLELVYADDPLFRSAADEALRIAETLAGTEGGADPAPGGAGAVAAFAADRLREEARIAAFSISGWDTHRGQAQAIGPALARLSDAILILRDRLGPHWQRTAVLAVTEFGRTAHENGSGGTDHGTGGAMLAAGGAVKGGRVLGRWPGLGEGDLYDGRDLMPTGDVRAMAGWALRSLYGIDRGLLEGTVFPGLDLGPDPGLIL